MARCSRLGTNFKSDTRRGGFGVIDSLGTSLDISADAVVVAGMECVQVAKGVESDGVFWGIVANCSGVARDFALCDVISGLSTDEEAIASKDGIGSDCGALE